VLLFQLALKESSTQVMSDIRLVSAIALASVIHVAYLDRRVLRKENLGTKKGASAPFFYLCNTRISAI